MASVNPALERQQTIPWLAIVVPIWNEADNMTHLAKQLLPLVKQGCELLLVDGGSQDDSLQKARALGLPITQSGKGRAAQMNAGAKATHAPVLLFLHADTQLPEGAVDAISDALFPKMHDMQALDFVTATPNVETRQWGRFDVRLTAHEQEAPLMFPVIGFMINLRSRLTGISTGDQAQFFLRKCFDSIGGFPNQPLMEDIEISKRLRKQHPPVAIAAKVTTSGRRWLSRGVWKTILLMWRLRWDYWRGVSAENIAARYR